MTRNRRPGERTKREVQRYLKMTIEHPRWNVAQLAEYFGVRHQEITRWRKISEVEPELREMVYTDRISYAVLDTLTGGKGYNLVKSEDRVLIARKVAAGHVGGGAPQLRELMALMPRVQHGPVRDKWIDLELGWGLDDLKIALLDRAADADAQTREVADRHRQMRVEADRMVYGPRALEFLRKVEQWSLQTTTRFEELAGEIDTLEDQEGAIMALPMYASAVPRELRRISERLWDLADKFEVSRRPRDSRPTTAAIHSVDSVRTIDI